MNHSKQRGGGENDPTNQAILPTPIKGCSCGVDQWDRLAGVSMTTTRFSNSDNTHSQI